MKKNFKGMLLLAAAASLGFASCSDESPWKGSDNEGGINLNFSTDGRVMRQTRADDGVSPVVPGASQFAINLAKSDGSYSKDWSSLDGFNRETSFPIGDYTISATYGDIESQGFESPYYKGSADVHVSPGATTDVNVVATLGNAMVSVRYTDDFKSNFKSWSAAVQPEGHDYVMFAQDEDRPAYVAPADEVKLDLTLTNEAGETVKIQPASFKAQARHHYVVTIGVTGNVTSGDLALDVVFDDDVVSETVAVSLGDELFSAPAPTVTAKGFDPAVTTEMFEYAEGATRPEFHVFAFGGLKEATLTVISNDYSPLFGRSVQLVGADALTQQQLAQEGLDCAGFFSNVDKMAVVNLKGFLEKIPAGEYTVELQAVDAMTRASEPVKFTAKINAVEIELSSTENVDFYSDEVNVVLSTNCPEIKNKVTFQVPDSNNRMVEATVKNITEVTDASGKPSRAALDHKYRYTLALEQQIRDNIDVKAFLGKKTAEVKVPMAQPDYTITADAFARKVVLKIDTDDANVAEAIANQLSFVNGTNAVPTGNVSRDANGLITIVGLTPGVQYVALKAKIGSFEKTVPEFTTEAETDLPNGNFSQVSETININKIQSGGVWTGTVGITRDYRTYTSIVRSTPNSWATVNDLTCWTGSDPMNTWFVVPSTFVENGQAVIRSVGYNHHGTVPPTYKKTGVYYNINAPAESEFEKAAGELFIGSYTFDGTEHRVEGMDWNTRPSSLSFDYKYAPQGDEQGEAYIKILSASGSVLAESSMLLSSSTTMQTKTIRFDSYAFGQKAAKLELGFKSTKTGVTPTIYIPSGSALNDGNKSIGDKTIGANASKAVAIGSQLWIDNVKLGYEATGTATPNSKPARKVRR